MLWRVHSDCCDANLRLHIAFFITTWVSRFSSTSQKRGKKENENKKENIILLKFLYLLRVQSVTIRSIDDARCFPCIAMQHVMRVRRLESIRIAMKQRNNTALIPSLSFRGRNRFPREKTTLFRCIAVTDPISVKVSKFFLKFSPRASTNNVGHARRKCENAGNAMNVNRTKRSACARRKSCVLHNSYTPMTGV